MTHHTQSQTNRLFHRICTGVLLLSIGMPISFAEVALDLKDESNWNIALGGFWATTSTTIRVDSLTSGNGTTFKAEDDLAWKDREFSPFLSIGYRFSKRHSLLASYWSIRREGVKQLTVDLDIGDETYTLGTTIDSQFVTDIYRLTYGYHFFDNKDWSVAFLAGLHVTNLEFHLRAVGGLGSSVQTAADAVAPLPTFGFSASYKINKQWAVSGWFQGFSLEYEEYDGKMLNTSLAVTYKPFESWAFSAGAVSFDIDLSSTNDRARGEFEYKYTGPFLSVHTVF